MTLEEYLQRRSAGLSMDEHVDLMVADTRERVRVNTEYAWAVHYRGGAASKLQHKREILARGPIDGPSLMELMDAANEDSEGRMPWEEGYEGRWEREARLAREAAAQEPVDEPVMVAPQDDPVLSLVRRFSDEGRRAA